MAKMTLIEIVQDILSDMNDDEVNSISDTIESLQVAQIVKSVYFEMMANKNWPHLRTLDTLEASGDNTKPTHMKLPELVKELEWIEYNCRKSTTPTRSEYKQIKMVSPDDFLRRTGQYITTNTDVDEITDYSGVKFSIKNDEHPTFCTSFDDDYIVFNSYDSSLDTTLQEAHTRCSVYVEPSWSMVDNHTPDLPSEAFPALLAEAKSTAFNRIKQAPDGKAEQQAVRQRSWLSRKSWRANGGIKLPTYGRRTRK
jgi:hypothetical protein